MDILRFALGQLQANCYFLIKDKKCLIIDPADSADFLLEEIQRRSLEVVGLITTHGHFDHVMAVGELQMSLKQVQLRPLPLYIHDDDLFLIKRLEETAEHFLGYKPHIIKPQGTESLKPGDMNIDEFHFTVMHTPGHTPGSCCIYFQDNVLFSGDTLFKQGIGRYDFSYSSKKELMSSLDRLFDFKNNTRVYPGHGEETSIGDEKILY